MRDFLSDYVVFSTVNEVLYLIYHRLGHDLTVLSLTATKSELSIANKDWDEVEHSALVKMTAYILCPSASSVTCFCVEQSGLHQGPMEPVCNG